MVITLLGLWLELSVNEWIAMRLICMALVIVTEAMNTALEYLTDLASLTTIPWQEKAKVWQLERYYWRSYFVLWFGDSFCSKVMGLGAMSNVQKISTSVSKVLNFCP